MADHSLAVLLSTYNGSQFLEAQLDSLLQQSRSDFILVIRDDGSADNTREILEQYHQAHPHRIHLLQSPDGEAEQAANLGASGSFSYLMEYVLANKETLGVQDAYMMFCDQDDVWYPDKIEQQMQLMKEVEGRSPGTDRPVLVHSDLRVVSEQLQLISGSFTRFQGLEVQRSSFCNLVISNLVTGCTALINEATAKKALPVPAGAIMHDWWLALVASGFGEVVFLDKPLVNYRQHGSNTIGAKEHKTAEPTERGFLQRIFSVQPNEHLLEVAAQAAVFLEKYGQELSSHDRRGLNTACGMRFRIGMIQRLYYRRARRF